MVYNPSKFNIDNAQNKLARIQQKQQALRASGGNVSALKARQQMLKKKIGLYGQNQNGMGQPTTEGRPIDSPTVPVATDAGVQPSTPLIDGDAGTQPSGNLGGNNAAQNNRLTPEQRGTFKDMKKAFQPISGGTASREDVEGFTGLRDPNTGILDTRLARIARRLKNANKDKEGNAGLIEKLRNRQQRVKGLRDFQSPDYDAMDEAESVEAKRTEELLSALFPETRGIEPENYENSPMYQWQRDEGMRALERRASAQGLTRSGANDELNRRLVTELGGMESDKARLRAQQEADRAQTSAQRLATILTTQAQLGQGDKHNTWRNINDTMALMLGTNAFGQGANAAGTQASAGTALGGQLAGMQQSAYPGMPPSGAFSMPPFMPPPAITPDFSGANSHAAVSGGTNNMNWISTFGSLIGQLLQSQK